MKGYKVRIWQAIHHNDHFSHNNERIMTLHVDSEEQARQKAETTLRPYEEQQHGDLKITVSSEYIYSIEYLGEVRSRIVYYYVDEDGKELL